MYGNKVWVPSIILHNLKKEEKKGVLNIPTLLNMAAKVLFSLSFTEFFS